MRDTCLRLCLAHATGAHHTFHTRLFRCFDCYDMVETHGYVIDYFRQKRNIMYDHGIRILFDRLPFLRQCKIVDQRMFDIVKDSTFGFGIRIGEDVFGHPSPIKTTLRVHRIRPEMFHDSLQAHASGFHDFSGEHIIIDKRRVQFTQMRSDGAFAGGDASGQPNSNRHNRHCNV